MTRIGFVGVGAISGIYLENITKRFKDIEIIGVCDLIRERAENAVKKYNIPKLYNDMYELFADPEVDVVSICTPNDQHEEMAIAALKAGKHVVAHKPLCTSLEELDAIEGDFTLRFMTSHPKDATEKLMDVMAAGKHIAHHFHLPMQSGSDTILHRMNRHYDTERYLQIVRGLRERMPDITLTSDIIVGFPGETEEDFVELCEFVKEAKFEHLGVFPYSREEDTPAYDFEDQIDEQIKQDRADIIMQEQLDINTANNEKMVGKTITVLCEDYDPVARVHFGRSAADAPDIDTKVYFKNALGKKRIAPGSFVDVKIEEAVDYDLIGKTVK